MTLRIGIIDEQKTGNNNNKDLSYFASFSSYAL